MTIHTAQRREAGIVLVVVLFFVLLLTAGIASFLRRVAMDAGVAMHRDRARQAESFARGGIRLGEALLLEDLRVAESGAPDSLFAPWARVRGVDLDDDPDVELRLEIEDAAARFNLNAMLQQGKVEEAARAQLEALLAGVLAIMPEAPAEGRYDPAQLAANVADWIDADEVASDGSAEEDAYGRRTPPTRPSNLPLLSVDELRLVDGFDGPLVDALRPFVGVHPLVGGGGINLNTAPPWVLAQLQRGSEISGFRPLEEEDVRRIVEAREEGPLCAGEGATAANCTPITEVLGTDTLDPAPTQRSNVFRVRATARVVDVERRIEAVIDRSDPAELVRLSWRSE
jgi:type II secretory pathway component PulK